MRLFGLLAVATAACFLGWFKVVDYDVFFHLETGQVILKTGRLVLTNVFSSIYPDYPWPNPEWLFQVLLALAYRAGGWFGVHVFKMLLVIALGSLLYALLLARGAHPLVASGFAIVPLAVMRFRFQERPQLFSYILFTLVLLVIDRARRGRRRSLWFLPPLFALWSNIHPELILGLLYLCGVIVGELVNGRSAHDETARNGLVRPLAMVTATCLAASLLNPEGYRVLTFPLLHVHLGPSVRLSEHATATFRSLPLYWAGLALGGLTLLLPRGRRDWAAILPATGLGILGIMYIREIPYFLLLASASVPASLHALAGSRVLFSRKCVQAFGIVAAAVALLWSFTGDRMQPYRWGWGIDEDFHPVAAANLLLAEPWQGNIFNHFNQGGYLIFRLFPRFGVFQDGRILAYPREFIARLNTQAIPEQWPKIAADFHLNLALVPVNDSVFFPRAEWALVFWDDAWCILARRTPDQDALLKKHEYRFFFPGQAPPFSAQASLLMNSASEMVRNQQERLHPSPELANNLGALLLRLGRRGEAEQWLRQALELSPGSASAWTNLGLLLADTGRMTEARHALGRALSLDPGLTVVRSMLETLPRQ